MIWTYTVIYYLHSIEFLFVISYLQNIIAEVFEEFVFASDFQNSTECSIRKKGARAAGN